MNEYWMNRLACRELIERSTQCVDDGDARAFADLFTEDAVLVRPNGQSIEGRGAIFQAYADRTPERVTRHLVTNVVIQAAGAGQWSARSYVLLWSGSAADEAGPWGRPAAARQILGEFADWLVPTGGGNWRIRRREARFVLHSV